MRYLLPFKLLTHKRAIEGRSPFRFAAILLASASVPFPFLLSPFFVELILCCGSSEHEN